MVRRICRKNGCLNRYEWINSSGKRGELRKIKQSIAFRITKLLDKSIGKRRTRRSRRKRR